MYGLLLSSRTGGLLLFPVRSPVPLHRRPQHRHWLREPLGSRCCWEVSSCSKGRSDLAAFREMASAALVSERNKVSHRITEIKRYLSAALTL